MPERVPAMSLFRRSDNGKKHHVEFPSLKGVHRSNTDVDGKPSAKAVGYLPFQKNCLLLVEGNHALGKLASFGILVPIN